MQKIFLVALTILSFNCLQAQTDSLHKKHSKNFDISNRPGDHIMIQLSSDHLTGEPDSIKSHQSGFSKGFNMYLMVDKPFKTNPQFSIAFGIGVGSSNISFKNMNVDVRYTGAKLPFTPLDSTNHFKKYKLSLSYLEVPVEFRFSSNPSDPNKSLKFALGVKAGTLINAHTKGKDLENKNNQLINSYTEKESNKKFFNGTRFMATARVGYGVFSIFMAYQLSNVLKDIVGPPMKLYQIGLTLSGL